MNWIKKTFANPFKIYLYGIILFLGFCVIGVPILSMGHSGGEQVPMTLIAYALNYFIYGLFFISILTSILFWNWFKKYWYINLIIFILTGVLIVPPLVTEIYDDRQPDLTVKYPRPVSKTVFFKDSLNAELAIDCLVLLYNRTSGLTDISHGIIDTIIYSPAGNEIFIIYAKKFNPNNLGNNLDLAYLSADKRGKNNEWELEPRLHYRTQLSGSYQTMQELKSSVRKFYFNEYKFKPTDSLEENYFWKTKKR
ncbi:hypothetical protein [Pedobacter frigiditerrae]|uniref:hypothetical protein n=1 Tax=Pedobacter frigiditerrae TaxID=2530452 RepID=UPI00292DB686|nr:hypothetical protein [Pedobacter frigiditerrae]